MTELEKVRDDEENTLRELRIFLREITVKLMSDRKFKEFHKPVDLEEVRTMIEKTAIFQVKVSGHSLWTTTHSVFSTLCCFLGDRLFGCD